MSKPETAIVVGGGIAGIAAAVRLAERGVRVTLLETRKKLGGRATSFVDVRSGEVLDNCQHVVLGCCTTYLDLLGRIGSADKLEWHSEQYWIEEGGRISVIKPGFLPAPLHFAVSLMRARFLTIGEVVAVGRAAAAIRKADRGRWEGRTFADFLRECRQPERAVRRFWSPIIVSACNLDVGRVSAASALQVFQEGFFPSARAAAIGVPSVPLVKLYEGVEGAVAKAGGRVLLGAGVERLDEGSATTSDGERHEADIVICAVPVERVGRLVDPDVQRRDRRFAGLGRFTHSPILGVHLKFDRPVLEWPHAVLVDRGTQWLFRKDGRAEQVHAVISAADAWMALSEDDIRERVEGDVRACLPRAREARLLWARSVKEKLATWAPVPGIDGARPAAAGEGSRLILAGDYTATGWPATMEGAARSGYAAAGAVLGEGGRAEVAERAEPAALKVP